LKNRLSWKGPTSICPTEGEADHGEGGGDPEAGILFLAGKVVILPLKRTTRLFVSSKEDHGQAVTPFSL
jgi:hypothetical protein